MRSTLKSPNDISLDDAQKKASEAQDNVNQEEYT